MATAPDVGTQEQSQQNLPEAALGYAQHRGWAVFPLVPRGKVPLRAVAPNGFKNATTDQEILRAVWTRYPTANIGVACGASDLVVIDVDASKGGAAQWRELVQRHGIDDHTLTSLTGGGGVHLFYVANSARIGNSAGKLAPGIDVRGESGYVVLPPSVHPNGQLYRWDSSCPPEPIPLPAVLVSLLTEPKRADLPATPVSMPRYDVPGGYIQSALKSELAAVAQATAGTRNDRLNRAAFALGQLVGANMLDRSDAEEKLLTAALSAGLGEREARATIASGLTAGQKQPRQIPPARSKRATHQVVQPTTRDNLIAEAHYVPPLPIYVRLDPRQEAAAQDAGRFLSDYVAFAAQASPLTPWSFHEAAGLFAGSLAIARRVHLAVSTENNWIYPNLYLLFCGHSTTPRKSTALHVLRGLIHAADMERFLLADRQTPEALTLDLTTQIPGGFDLWSADQQERWLAERALAAQRGWLLEEAGHLLDSFNRDYSAGLLPLVLDLYDASDYGPTRNTISRGRESINQPYVSVFGCTTYGALAAHTQNTTHWHNGLWARFALVGSDTRGEWRFWPSPLSYPPGLVARLRCIAYELLPMPQAQIVTCGGSDGEDDDCRKEVALTAPLSSHAVVIQADAWNWWERYCKAVSFDMLPEEPDAVPPRFYASYGRLGTMLIKTAIILATFDAERLPITVEARHVYRAQTIVEGWRASLHRILSRLAEVNTSDLADQVKALLARRGRDWISRRELLRALALRWSAVEPTLRDLEASGEIERRPSQGARGPASEEYRLSIAEG